ncbi:type I 3-dehydroquinate dehydratase [archaeon SCG-AAA382B04]|nr:type I 3-dehydroquinate dehydratase [archaeon SCG-AAA382B04]
MRVKAKKPIDIGDVVVGDEEVICGCVGEKDVFDMIDVAEEIAEKVDLVELRVDYLDNPSSSDVKRQIANNEIDAPLILTIRRENEGGDFVGQEEERAKLYVELMEFVDAIDLEYHTPDNYRRKIIQKAKEKNAAKIVSYHNFSRTGSVEELKIRLEECLELGDLGKVATKANSPKDVLNLVRAAYYVKKEWGEPLVALGMGEGAKYSRVFGSYFGSDIIYASGGEQTAPGQLDVADVKEVVRRLR